jgi:hypothetical protein
MGTEARARQVYFARLRLTRRLPRGLGLFVKCVDTLVVWGEEDLARRVSG